MTAKQWIRSRDVDSKAHINNIFYCLNVMAAIIVLSTIYQPIKKKSGLRGYKMTKVTVVLQSMNQKKITLNIH